MFESKHLLVSRTRIREFLTFAAGSAAGLAVDLVGFQLLLLVGLDPWLANAISSTVSIGIVYLLVTRYSFGVEARFWTYTLFAAWYGLSIVTFSALIQGATNMTDWQPLALKLLSVPISFGLNYLFSRFLFRLRQRRGENTPSEDPAPISYIA